mmetsp:Transcript_183352/g.581437  ORF Transcript_183352/g.581437 Transcript_183352/m.581437 type:complete len:696 (-) Transcript_183352:19-2106(-)
MVAKRPLMPDLGLCRHRHCQIAQGPTTSPQAAGAARSPNRTRTTCLESPRSEGQASAGQRSRRASTVARSSNVHLRLVSRALGASSARRQEPSPGAIRLAVQLDQWPENGVWPQCLHAFPSYMVHDADTHICTESARRGRGRRGGQIVQATDRSSVHFEEEVSGTHACGLPRRAIADAHHVHARKVPGTVAASRLQDALRYDACTSQRTWRMHADEAVPDRHPLGTIGAVCRRHQLERGDGARPEDLEGQRPPGRRARAEGEHAVANVAAGGADEHIALAQGAVCGSTLLDPRHAEHHWPRRLPLAQCRRRLRRCRPVGLALHGHGGLQAVEASLVAQSGDSDLLELHTQGRDGLASIVNLHQLEKSLTRDASRPSAPCAVRHLTRKKRIEGSDAAVVMQQQARPTCGQGLGKIQNLAISLRKARWSGGHSCLWRRQRQRGHAHATHNLMPTSVQANELQRGAWLKMSVRRAGIIGFRMEPRHGVKLLGQGWNLQEHQVVLWMDEEHASLDSDLLVEGHLNISQRLRHRMPICDNNSGPFQEANASSLDGLRTARFLLIHDDIRRQLTRSAEYDPRQGRRFSCAPTVKSTTIAASLRRGLLRRRCTLDKWHLDTLPLQHTSVRLPLVAQGQMREEPLHLQHLALLPGRVLPLDDIPDLEVCTCRAAVRVRFAWTEGWNFEIGVPSCSGLRCRPLG